MLLAPPRWKFLDTSTSSAAAAAPLPRAHNTSTEAVEAAATEVVAAAAAMAAAKAELPSDPLRNLPKLCCSDAAGANCRDGAAARLQCPAPRFINPSRSCWWADRVFARTGELMDPAGGVASTLWAPQETLPSPAASSRASACACA